MPLPEGWREFPVPDQGYALYSVREFRAADAKDDAVTLCLYNRGLALNDLTAESFTKVLAQKNHHLTPGELDQLELLLRDAGDPEVFSLLDGRTEEINGRKVLVIEGRYIKSGTRMLRFYFDVNEDGQFVEEVFFSAPPDEYDKSVKAVKACFHAVVWN